MIKIIRLNEKNLDKTAEKAAAFLKQGKIIVSPTDTVYGILGDATNPETIKKIFLIKNRPSDKIMPVFVKDIASTRRYAYISDAKAKFLEKVWPGPVTVILHHKEKLPAVLTAGRETIGMRIPEHPFVLKLLEKTGVPLVQTSANISSQPPAQNIKEISAYFKKSRHKPDLIIDAGPAMAEASTVIDLTRDKPLIIRAGIIGKEELDKMLSL